MSLTKRSCHGSTTRYRHYPSARQRRPAVPGLIDHGLGRRRLSDLSVEDCDEFLRLTAAGLRPGAQPIGSDHLARTRSMLVAVVRNEIRLGTIGRNVAELSHRPQRPNRRRRATKRRALTRDELRVFLAVSKGVNVVLVDLIGRNGLRPAEARALTWASADLDGRLLTVRTQMDEDDDPDDVKTSESERTIRLDGTTVDRLSAWREVQRGLRDRHADRWQDLDLVVSTRYGTAINRNNVRRSVTRLCGKAGIEPAIVPYELRYTAISHQADAGRSSWEIADWAGT